jgi:hypothetical protein
MWTERAVNCSQAVHAFREGLTKTAKIGGSRAEKEPETTHKLQLGVQVVFPKYQTKL